VDGTGLEKIYRGIRGFQTDQISAGLFPDPLSETGRQNIGQKCLGDPFGPQQLNHFFDHRIG
jgi:hypothetical protein